MVDAVSLRFQTVVASALDPELLLLVQRVFDACFPGSDFGGCPADEFVGHALGFHEAADTSWLLLWKGRQLVGLATAAAYHDSLFVFNLCVLPSHRRRGYGAALLHQCAALAAGLGLFALSGAVDAARADLRGYYEALGASTVEVGQGGGGSGAPAQLRFRREFAAADLAALKPRVRSSGTFVTGRRKLALGVLVAVFAGRYAYGVWRRWRVVGGAAV